MTDLPDYYTQTSIAEAEAAKFKGGAFAARPIIPTSRDIYYATDTKVLYICIVDGIWTGFDASILVQGTLTLYENMDANSKKITDLAAPTLANDATRKVYVDNLITGDVAAHAGLTTGIHGVGASTIASVANIATHAALTATHGVVGTIIGSEDTIAALTAPTADFSMNTHKITDVVNPAAAQDAATKASSEAAATAAINGHKDLTTGVHGVGASTIASVLNITTHAALTTGVHGVTGTIIGSEDTIAALTAPTADFSMNTHKITNVVDPAAAQDVATKTSSEAAATAAINGHKDLTTGVHGVTGTIIGSEDTIAALTAPTADFSMNTHKITNVVNPAAAQDVATKKYVDDALYVEGARVYQNADIAISDNSWAVLPFNSERYDTDAIHNTVTNNSRLTCKTAGKYIIVWNGYFEGHSTGIRQTRILFNGTTDIAEFTLIPDISLRSQIPLTTVYSLAVNDYVEVKVYQNSGGNLDIVYRANFSPEFMMQRIG